MNLIAANRRAPEKCSAQCVFIVQMTKVLCISDTHYPFDPAIWEEKIEQCDMIVHAGDLGMWGDLKEWPSRLESLQKLASYGKPVYFCPGNHDTAFDSYVERYMLHKDLENSGICASAIAEETPAGRLLMMPWVTNLEGWAFNRTEEELSYILDNAVPSYDKIDVIVSHAPVRGILDWVDADNPAVGCKAYLDLFARLKHKPKLWVCGHIHESYGEGCVGGTIFVNASHCNKDYKMVNAPILVEI